MVLWLWNEGDSMKDIKELDKAVNRLNNIIDTIDSGICIYALEPQVKLNFMSDRALDIFGLTRNQFKKLLAGDCGKKINAILDELLETALTALANGDKGSFRMASYRADKRPIWLSVNCTLGQDVGPAAFLTILDVTEEVKIEQRVRWKEERYRLLSEGSDVVTFDYDPLTDDFVYTINTAKLGRHDLTIHAFIQSRERIQFIHPDDMDAYIHAGHAAIMGESGILECRIDFYGMGWRYYRVKYVSVKDDGGKVDRIVGRADDIHDEQKEKSTKTYMTSTVTVGRQIFVRTFGYFDIFLRGRPIAFSSAKSKELLALLVDRQGGFVMPNEAIACLWEDEEANTRTLSRYRKVAVRLKNTLAEYGVEDIIEYRNGLRRVRPEAFHCDLYNYLTGKPEYQGLFKGNYLLNYSWSETTLSTLQ